MNPLRRPFPPALFIVLFFLSALPRSGHAATAPSAAPERYQGDLLGETLTRHSLRLETAPEGKRIERIVIVTGEVFDHRDPWPLLLNSLHATTRPEVISRELLFREGDPWLNEKITETERNLRATLFVSVARIVPARGTAANTVVALVLTKDLWSLRTNFDFSYLGGRLEHFLTELEERNLGGTNRNTALTFETDLGAWSVGQRYGDPYLAGTELRLDQRAALYFNRATGRNEGGYGLLSVEAPLRTLATKWGWQLSVSGRTDQYRRFSEGRLAEVLLGGTGERFPFEFGRRLFEGSARLTRSFGQSLKHQLSFGWRGYSREYRVGTATGASATPTAAAAAEFRSNYVPRNENAGLVFIGYRAYVPEYRAFLELDSYAVTEDLRLGPDFRAEARVAQPAFGFGSRYFEPAASLDWALSAGGHLWQSSLSVQSRYQPELGYRTPWVNRFAKFEIKDAFPAWGAFRLHARAAAIRRWHDQDRNVEFLGGDDALRGYPSGYLTGSQLAAANLELRSRSLRFKSVHWGTAFFYDVGDAFNAPSELRLHQSVGAGLRIVFPEFNRAALRLDFAMPLERLPDAMPSYFVAKFGQAF